MKNNQKIVVGLFAVSLIMLPGCEWSFKSKTKDHNAMDDLLNQGAELVTMDGKRIISEKSLERDFEQLLNENPQLKSVLPLMPDAKYNFLQGMVSQAVVDKYVEENGIDKQEEYQRELAQMERSVRRMLNTKYFGSAHPIEVSDADVKKFYEENKESMPELLISRGGVKAAGVQFDKEADAKAFATKAKGKDIATVAKAEKIANDRVRDFNFVNDQSVGVNPAVRSKVVSLKKFPATEVVKGDEKSWWVVNATEAQEAKYRPFEQVQAGLKQYVEKERRMAMFDKEIGTLKDKYVVKINDDFFKKQQQNLALDDELSENAETMQAALTAQPNDNARAA